MLLSMKRTSIPVIVTEHVDPREFPCGRIWEMLRRQHYRGAACVVSVSHSVDEYFSGVSDEKRRVIHNPLLIDRTLASVGFRWPDAAKRHVVGIGRLTHQKGFDLLIKAYAQVAGRHPDWALHIVGEGEERSALLALIAKLGLESKVTLPGWLDNPYSMLGASDLLVMSSRYEGFGNVLCEAMACGVPVVSFDCPSGPSDIIRHGEDGLLVPAQDVEGLASAMDRLMSDEGERRALGARAPVSMRRFDLASILPQWEALLDELATGT